MKLFPASEILARNTTRAFTRTELIVVLVCVGLLCGMVLPLLGHTERAGQQAWCLNNVRLIGRAFQVWQKDHGNVVSWRVPLAEGGTQAPNKSGATWYEFAWLSNQLVSPQLLVCPSDSGKRMARDFSRNSDGGYINAGFRDNATSYWLGTDAGYLGANLQGAENTPDHVTSGDRNLRIDDSGLSCSAGFNNVNCIFTYPITTEPRWTNGVHGRFGNVLFNDGRAEQLSDRAVREALATGDDNGSIHLLIP